MSRRTRKPTLRAIEAAQTAIHLRSAPAVEQARSASSTPRHASPASSVASAGPAAAPVKRNGRAVNARGAQAVARELARNHASVPGLGEEEDEDGTMYEDDSQQEPQQDMTLYCVCLGYDTGEQPMIQCEHCSNWFHFSCVSLNDDIAAKIEAYACDMCEQMGMGATRLLAAAQVGSSSSTAFYAHAKDDFDDATSDAGPPSGDDDDGDESIDDDHDAPDDTDDDIDDGKPVPSKKKKRKTAARGKKRDLATSDDDYDGEMHDDAAPKKKKRASKPAPRRSSTHDVKPSTSVATTSVPQSDKTRTHVVKQLTTIFSSIFSAAGGGGGGAGSAGIEVRSGAFAEEVESELFDGFAEVDDKGVRGPRAKYVAKFRSLHFNLKSNAYLRSRVANNELGAAKLIHLSAEDLQTPELRAMAESVRAASLRNSVKEALAAPTAKRTHKGEEEIDNEASRIIAAEQHERAQEERDKMEVAQQKKKDERDSAAAALQSPLDAAFADSHYSAASPGAGAASPDSSRESPAAAAAVRPRSSLVPTGGSPGPAGADEREGTHSGAASPGSPFDNGSPRPSARPRQSASSFDMSSIWTKAKAASPPVDSQPDAAAAPGAPQEPVPQSDDPFDVGGAKAADSGDDDFEDDLFRDPAASPSKRKPAALKPPALDELPPVWAGDFIVPDEGGFPTFAVQVGGRPLGSALGTWRKLLPKGLTTAGRIPTPTAQKYLVDCALAPTRELVILALLPDLTGPSTQFPHKPAADKCLAKHQHIVDQYVRRDRIGVVQPPKELGKLVKDIYIVPLRNGDDLPDFVELVDEHIVPPSRKRDKDLVLAVLVVQKGVLPTVQPAPLAVTTPPPAPPPSSTSTSFVSAPPAAPLAVGPAPLPAGPPSFPSSFAGSPFPHHPPGPPSAHPPYSPPAHVAYGAPPPPFGAPPPPAPPSTAAPPAFDPVAMQSLLAQVNPDTLNSLLANPALLNGIPGFGAPSSAPAPVAAAAAPAPAPLEPSAARGPPVHPSRMALLGAVPPAGPAGTTQSQQQAPAPYGAASDGGWGARQGGQGYGPAQGGAGGAYGY
ncbi:hypothetical protein JCM3775_000073 [Rhodotorula graminis]